MWSADALYRMWICTFFDEKVLNFALFSYKNSFAYLQAKCVFQVPFYSCDSRVWFIFVHSNILCSATLT